MDSRKVATRYRTAEIYSDALGCTVYVDYEMPRIVQALAAKDALSRHSAVKAVSDAGARTEAEAASALEGVTGEGSEGADEAMRDLAAICAGLISAVYYEGDDGDEDIAWSDDDSRPWAELSEKDRAGLAYDNPDLCVWSIAFEVIKGAYPSRVGKSSVRRRASARRT